MKREPRLETMKEVTQNATRSWRRERTISIRCISLQAFSHSPGGEVSNRRESESGRAGDVNKGAPAGTLGQEAGALRELGRERGGIREGRAGTRLNEGGREAGEGGLRPGTWQHSLNT